MKIKKELLGYKKSEVNFIIDSLNDRIKILEEDLSHLKNNRKEKHKHL